MNFFMWYFSIEIIDHLSSALLFFNILRKLFYMSKSSIINEITFYKNSKIPQFFTLEFDAVYQNKSKMA